MTRTLTPTELRQLRWRHQWLARRTERSAAEVLRRVCALQSQEWASAQLAVHARADGLTSADVIRAREIDRSIALSWSIRGTLHLVTSEDLRWLLTLCGEGAIRGTRRRYQQLGLTEAIREEALEAIFAILAREGALNRAELATALAEYGIPVAGQAIHHLVRFAALRGLICHGPERAGKLTFVLLDQWLPETAPALADPLRELAQRYLQAGAPATMEDFAAWSGLGAAQVREAWASAREECVTVATATGDMLMLKTQSKDINSEPSLRLLPRYDNYLLSHKVRDFIVAESHARQVYPGGGLIRACVLHDGVACASWKVEKRKRALRLRISPFDKLNDDQLAQLEARTARLGAFLDRPAELLIESAG